MWHPISYLEIKICELLKEWTNREPPYWSSQRVYWLANLWHEISISAKKSKEEMEIWSLVSFLIGLAKEWGCAPPTSIMLWLWYCILCRESSNLSILPWRNIWYCLVSLSDLSAIAIVISNICSFRGTQAYYGYVNSRGPKRNNFVFKERMNISR